MQNYFLPENATASALNKGGFQLGQGRAPEYNVPSYTAPTPSNPMAHLNAGVQSGLGGYMLAKGMGLGGGAPAGTTSGVDFSGNAVSYAPGAAPLYNPYS